MIWHNNAKMTSKFRSQLEAENAVLQDMVAEIGLKGHHTRNIKIIKLRGGSSLGYCVMQ